MLNYNSRQLIMGAVVTLACILGTTPAAISDEVKILALPYTQVQVVDVSDEFIKFTTLSETTVAKPMVSVRRVILDAFPLFSAAERLADSGNGKDAIPVYEDAIKGLPGRQESLLKKSDKLRKEGKAKDADRLARLATAKWPQKLFELRLAQAKKTATAPKKTELTRRPTAVSLTARSKSKTSKFNPCPVCNGAGFVKCPECNGSGYVKCPHIDNNGKRHVNWYDKCRKCNGKGKIPKHYKQTVKYKRPGKRDYTKTKIITKYEPCPDCFSIMDENGVKIYVTWVCPHCGDSLYKGYIKCKKCGGSGKIKCDACNGTGERPIADGDESPTRPVKSPTKKSAIDKPKTWKP